MTVISCKTWSCNTDLLRSLHVHLTVASSIKKAARIILNNHIYVLQTVEHSYRYLFSSKRVDLLLGTIHWELDIIVRIFAYKGLHSKDPLFGDNIRFLTQYNHRCLLV